MTLSRLVLTSGRRVDLGELRLTSTYGEMLDGYPCRPVNELRIKGLLRSAEHDYPTAPVHLVPPPHEYPDHYPGAFGPVEMLPAVACVGVFRSTALTPPAIPSSTAPTSRSSGSSPTHACRRSATRRRG